jgi:hypothetical protein
VASASSVASWRAHATTGRQFARKPLQSFALRWVRHACSQRVPVRLLASTSEAGNRFAGRHCRTISRTDASSIGSTTSPCAAASAAASLGAVSVSWSSTASSAIAAPRASLLFCGIIVA